MLLKAKLVSCKGGSFVELAIILPVLVFVILGAIEFSRVLRIKQEVAAFNDQLANGLIRDCRWTREYLNFFPWPGQACVDKVLFPDGKDKPATSLTQLVDASSSAAIFPGAEIHLGLYRCGPEYNAPDAPPRKLGAIEYPVVGADDPPIGETELASKGLLSACTTAGVLAVSRTHYKFSALLPTLFGRGNYEIDTISVY